MAFDMIDWEPAHIVPVAGFAILALALLLFFFSAMRTRRGTTEWMTRLDRSGIAALRCQKLRMLDLLWAVLSAFAGAGVAALANGGVATALSSQTLLYALCAVEFYAILRLFCADVLTAVLFSAMLPAVLPDVPLPTALLLASLLALLLWLGRDPTRELFPWALLLPVTTILFGAAILLRHSLFWLAPVYVVAFFLEQVQRWRFGDESRGGRLLLSLLLSALTVALCAAGLFAAHILLEGAQLPAPRGFVHELAAAALRLLRQLRPTPRRLILLQWRECYLLLYAAASLPPVIYGLTVRRELRCLAILLLPIPFLLLRIFGGCSLMALGLLPLPAWTLSTLGKRWRSAEILSAVAVPLFYLMELLLP